METLKLTQKVSALLEGMRQMESQGKTITAYTLADHMGLAANSVTIMFQHLIKHGLAVKSDKTETRTVEKDGKTITSPIAIYTLTDSGKTASYEVKNAEAEEKPLSDNAQAVLKALEKGDFTTYELADALFEGNTRSAVGVINSLVKKGLVLRDETNKKERVFTNGKGNEEKQLVPVLKLAAK